MQTKSASGNTYSQAGSGVSSGPPHARSSTVSWAYSWMRSTWGKWPITTTELWGPAASTWGRTISKASVRRMEPSGSSTGSST